jgi:hypothetical protein
VQRFDWNLTCTSAIRSGCEPSRYGSSTSGCHCYLYCSDAGIRRLLLACVNNHESLGIDAHLRPTYSDAMISCIHPQGRQGNSGRIHPR